MDAATALDIVYETRRDGGGTYKAREGYAPAGLRSGYVVGGVLPSRTAPNRLAEASRALLDFARDKTVDTLLSMPGLYLGTWVDDDTVYFDVVQRISSKGEALDLAQRRGELAIWDVARSREVRVQ